MAIAYKDRNYSTWFIIGFLVLLVTLVYLLFRNIKETFVSTPTPKNGKITCYYLEFCNCGSCKLEGKSQQQNIYTKDAGKDTHYARYTGTSCNQPESTKSFFKEYAVLEKMVQQDNKSSEFKTQKISISITKQKINNFAITDKYKIERYPGIIFEYDKQTYVYNGKLTPTAIYSWYRSIITSPPITTASKTSAAITDLPSLMSTNTPSITYNQYDENVY